MGPLALALLLAGTADAFTLPKSSGFFLNKNVHKPASTARPTIVQGNAGWLSGRRSLDTALSATVERTDAAASAGAAADPIGDYVQAHGGNR
jgi:hypothetical protein